MDGVEPCGLGLFQDFYVFGARIEEDFFGRFCRDVGEHGLADGGRDVHGDTVERGWDVGNRRVGLQAFDLVCLGVDGVNSPTAVVEGSDGLVPVFLAVGGSTDDRDGFAHDYSKAPIAQVTTGECTRLDVQRETVYVPKIFPNSSAHGIVAPVNFLTRNAG